MPLEGITHKDALQVIRNAGDKLQFRVMRRKDFPPSPIHSKLSTMDKRSYKYF